MKSIFVFTKERNLGCPFCDGQRVDDMHTLGYLKHKIDIDNLKSNLYINENNGQGIYVKKSLIINDNNFSTMFFNSRS